MSYPTRNAIVTAVTAGTTSAQGVAAGTRAALLVINSAASATVAFNFGGTAVINGAVSITLVAGEKWSAVQTIGYIPSDALNFIASGASTPVTVVT